jgi:hypothetical protein
MTDKPEKEYVTRMYYSDRLFSQILRHFSSFFASKLLQKPHIHWPYPDSYTDSSFAALFDIRQVVDRVDAYFNVQQLMQEQRVAYWCDQTIFCHFPVTDVFSPEHLTLMRNAYMFDRHTPTYDTGAFNVAVHIRRGDIERFKSESRYTHTDFFTYYINVLHSMYPFAHFHIYSDSNIYLPISSQTKVHYHILENLLESMHDMICADVLLMSIGSNMSFFAGLMNTGVALMDKRKLDEPFNAEGNRLWAKHPRFHLEESAFLDSVAAHLKHRGFLEA